MTECDGLGPGSYPKGTCCNTESLDLGFFTSGRESTQLMGRTWGRTQKPLHSKEPQGYPVQIRKNLWDWPNIEV